MHQRYVKIYFTLFFAVPTFFLFGFFSLKKFSLFSLAGYVLFLEFFIGYVRWVISLIANAWVWIVIVERGVNLKMISSPTLTKKTLFYTSCFLGSLCHL
ncbi:MAG: hypothetical protein NZL96_02730 [Patescibacteria group bacterium]|nr:hypothetical protein [Patescibacteria group bacterium]